MELGVGTARLVPRFEYPVQLLPPVKRLWLSNRNRPFRVRSSYVYGLIWLIYDGFDLGIVYLSCVDVGLVWFWFWFLLLLLLMIWFACRENFPVSVLRLKTLEVHSDNNGSSNSNNNSNSQSIRHPAVSKSDNTRMPELSFNRLQLTDKECQGWTKRNFGCFVAREAIVDEEYWTAAWLRAEAHWEYVSYMRHIDSYKRKYAEEEFYGLKRRCSGQEGNILKCFCFVAVKKEDKNVRRTALNSVVGTLDLSVRQYLRGETYPGEVKRTSTLMASPEPFNAHKYAYISNVCVSKFARRQSVATNMLYLATDVATLFGMKQLFVHVNADNKPAQELYKKTGFAIVEAASCRLAKDQRLLMSLEL